MVAPVAPTAHAPTRSREEMVSAARKKLKTYRAKQAHSPMSGSRGHAHRRSHSRGSSASSTTDSVPPAPIAQDTTRHQKRRSHSRSASILGLDIDGTLQLPSSGLKNQQGASSPNLGGLDHSFSFGAKSRPTAAAPSMITIPTSPVRVQHQQNASRPRPSSHHRRRSSVSTRRDSVDMMGFDPVALGALGSVAGDDKDDVVKVRESALLALEGRSPKPGKVRPEIVSHMGFSKVEIPDWKTPDVERTFDWTINAKPNPFPLGLNNALAGKRDSFGKSLVPSASTKAELAVLVEEEEEEEPVDTRKNDITSESSPAVVEIAMAPVIQQSTTESAALVQSPTTEACPETVHSSPSGRPRPASLNLKALALSSSTTIALPTPSATPSPTPAPRMLPGMKPLNLGNPTRRRSMINLGGASTRNGISPSRHQSLRSQSRGSDSPQSSRGSFGLSTRLPLTPGTMTPPSVNSATTGVEGFLSKNQEVLVSRIEQLEKALAESRRVSIASDCSSTPSIIEEHIALIAELRTERNALVEEIAGWRTRVEDLERQAALYVKRVETERHECFVARERVQKLEVERIEWESKRLTQEETIACARDDAAAWRAKYEEVSKSECYWQAKAVNLEADVHRLGMELTAARRLPPPSTRCPTAPRRFDGSVSSASTTDVDEAASGEIDGWKMKPRVSSPLSNMDVLLEEEEEAYEEGLAEDEDEEPRCVEEDEDDVSSDLLDEVNEELGVSDSMGSFGSPESQHTPLPAAPIRSELAPGFKFPPPAPAPSHARTGSMIKGWQMPRGPVTVKQQSLTKPDRFFDQLEHLDLSSGEDLPIPPSLPSPGFGKLKGDGGASAFTFGTKRSTVTGSMRGHGTRASRASISLGAFDGLGLPPFTNPNPEWIVRSESAESLTARCSASSASSSPRAAIEVQDRSPVSDTMVHLPRQEPPTGSSLESRSEPVKTIFADETHTTNADHLSYSNPDLTPRTTKLPTFIPIPTTFATSSTQQSSTSRASGRRKLSLTRVQPSGRAPPRVPFDTSYDRKSSSPFSISYSRTSSRTSKTRLSIAEAEAIEAAIMQARAMALEQQQSRLPLAGLTNWIPWGKNTGGSAKATPGARERPPARKERGTVSREAQLARLRREMDGKQLSGPCCSRCKTDVIQL